MSVCLVINLSSDLDYCGRRSGAVIPAHLRPTFLHDDIEGARKEAARLHEKLCGPGRFVIFQAVEFTELRQGFGLAGKLAVCVEPFGVNVPVVVPERPPRKKRQRKGGGA